MGRRKQLAQLAQLVPVQVMVPPDEREEWKQAAALTGLRLSEWVRYAVRHLLESKAAVPAAPGAARRPA